MTSSLSPGSSADTLDEAARHLRAVATLLIRIFDAFAALPTGGEAAAHPPNPDDSLFWAGLRHVTTDILRTTEEIQRLVDSARPPQAGAVSSTNGAGSDSDQPSPAGLASTLARDALAVDLGTIIEDHEDEWTALVHAIRGEKFHGDNGARDGVEPLELYSKVITTLPAELRRDFRRLTEWRTVDEIAERQAAFELGRQIERQARMTGR